MDYDLDIVEDKLEGKLNREVRDYQLVKCVLFIN